MDDFAVDADFLLVRIDARAELGDHLAIDFDAAVEDQLLALAAAGDAGGGENFLQSIGALVRRRRGVRTAPRRRTVPFGRRRGVIGVASLGGGLGRLIRARCGRAGCSVHSPMIGADALPRAQAATCR